MFGDKKIAVIGGGKMGGIIVGGLLTQKMIAPEHIIVADKVKERLDELNKTYHVITTEDGVYATKEGDIIIIAVKPQDLTDLLKEISPFINEKKLLISIAAGITTHFLEKHLPTKTPVIRAMPNTCAAVGAAATALTRGTYASVGDLEIANSIFSSFGITVTVKEDLMDAVTGLSGSGPAYVFVMIEALTDAGVLMGLSREVALTLVAQTFLGAAKLCLTGDYHPATLKDMVTSPGGTTIAGLKALEEGKIRATLMAAVQAATFRSRELASR